MVKYTVLILLVLIVQNVLAFAPQNAPFLSYSSRVMLSSHNHDCGVNKESNDHEVLCQSRRVILASLPFLLPVSTYASTGSMKTSQYAGKSSSTVIGGAKIKPDAAFEGLVKARQELQTAQKTYLRKKDYDGLREYLESAENINNFEPNALAILSSKKLDDEDKKAIGTIRTYGSGADVIIMYGGLLAEIDPGNEEPDYATVQKYMTRTMDSLDEVITICRNGGFA